MDGEVWKPVVGYEGLYEVSDLGRVRSVARILNHKHIGMMRKHAVYLKQFSSFRNGRRRYFNVRLCGIGDDKTKKVHRLVAAAFIGPCPDGMQVNHIDGNVHNNTVRNLEYVTPKMNAIHARDTGLRTDINGEAIGTSVLTTEDVRLILHMRAASTAGMNRIAKAIGISKTTAQRIVRGRNWKHVT